LTDSLSHTRAERALDQFLRMSRMSQDLGFSHQVVEDEVFKGDTIRLRGREVVNFGLCSYLGISDDRRLVEAAVDALHRYGSGFSSSIAYTALPLYSQLRERLEQMLGADVVIAASTTLAHLAALPVMIRGDDHVLVDAYAHASLLQAMPSVKANGARVTQIPHNDTNLIADYCRANPKTRVWFIGDGIYSMHGDTMPAEEVFELLESRSNLWVYCDDAHGLGWEGERGQGNFLRRVGWHERLVMSFGLSKSFGALGGVVASPDARLLEVVRMTGGPLVFGGPIPPASLAAGIASADIHLSDELEGLQADLAERIDLVNTLASKLDLPLTSKEATPMWMVEIGKTFTMGSILASVLDDGFYLNPAIFPVVPRGRSGMRFTVTRYLSHDQIGSMLISISEAIEKYSGPEDVVDLTILEAREREESRP